MLSRKVAANRRIRVRSGSVSKVGAGSCNPGFPQGVAAGADRFPQVAEKVAARAAVARDGDGWTVSLQTAGGALRLPELFATLGAAMAAAYAAGQALS